MNLSHKLKTRPGRLALAVLALAAAAATTACSDNDNTINPEPVVPGTQADEIHYNVTGSNTSRAAQIYNSNNLPTQFYISAWAMAPGAKMGTLYIRKDLIKDMNPKGAHNWVDQSGLRYWPNSGETVNFLATNSANSDFEAVDTETPLFKIPFTVNSDANGQTDLLYASTYDQVKTATGVKGNASQAVNLDFHHALSQVAFTAQSSNPHILVYVGNITLVGPSAVGTFTQNAQIDSTATWNIAANYTPGTFSASTFNSNGAISVGTAVTPLTSGSDQTSEAMMLIPQKVSAANPSTANPWNGQVAYLKIDCIIYNVAKPEEGVNETEDTLIFGIKDGDMTNFDTLYIPLNVDWQMGKRYIYNLRFGQGNGGYRKDGSAALIPVNYAITVDNWAQGGTTDFNEPTL